MVDKITWKTSSSEFLIEKWILSILPHGIFLQDLTTASVLALFKQLTSYKLHGISLTEGLYKIKIGTLLHKKD